MRSRRGFALMAVLWIIAGAAITGMTVTHAARERVRTAINRNALLRAEWAAEDCLARAIAALDMLLGSRIGFLGSVTPAPADSLPLLLGRDPRVVECPGEVRLIPVGMTIDLASATAEMFRRAFAAQGIAQSTTDSLVDALLDWRDADDMPRLHGCERDCYAALERPRPRNAAFADVAELDLVRGFEFWDAGLKQRTPLDRLFTTDPGRTALTWAPYEVLAALPGIGRVGARDLVEHRQRTRDVFGDLASIGRALSPIARDSFALAFDQLSRLATVNPDAWQIRVVAPRPVESGAVPPLGVSLTARVNLAAKGIRVQRRRFTR